MFSRNLKLSLGFILFLGLFYSSFAICLNSPTFIRVNSGNNYAGEFNSAYLNSAELIYIKGDIDNYPLKVDFYFEGIENDCFSSEDDVQMRLFSSGVAVSADSITTIGTQTIAKFNFDIATIAPDTFNSNYIIKNKNNLVGTEDIIKFGVDDDVPLFTSFSHSPNDVLILPNTTVTFNYAIQDTKSTLDFLSIVKGTTSIISFNDHNESFASSFSEVLLTSRNYQFSVKDKLANQATKIVSYIVDGNGPSFTNFKVESYTKNEFGTRKVTFSVEVQDVSYSVLNTSPIVLGNFTSINNVDLAKVSVCTRIDGEDDKYKCMFEDVGITLINQTTTLPFIISSIDVLGNSNSQSFNKEIFYDTAGPLITDFYLINQKGEKNIFNALDEDVRIVVKFTDESAEVKTDIRLFPDFDGIQTFLIPNCDNISNGKGTCYWDLDSTIAKYSGIEIGNIVYKLTLVDVYGNPTTETLNLSINNEKPEITSIELIETTDIKDRIINSGEKINFRVFIKDSNLKFDSNFIYGNFSTIDFRDGMDKKAASCNYYNESLIQCDFTAIIVQNGYMNRNVSFVIIDTAGNTNIEKYNVEVFAIGDEVFSSFKISDIIITNSLDRYVIKNAGLDAWFEGNIQLQDGNPDIKIVNYQLKNCNDSQMNPVLLGTRNLYPSEVQVSDIGTVEADHNFVVKVEVKTHPNYADLETSKMKCTMAVLKRDNEQIYPAELVEFNLQFEYFNLPYDNLLSANAASILAMIDDAEFLGSWFDSLYKIYNIFNKICSLISTGGGIISGVGQAWYSVSVMLHSFQVTAPAATATDGAIFGLQGTISKLRFGLEGIGGIGEYLSPVKTMCDYITCKNGGLLTNFWQTGDGSEIGSFFNDLNSFYGMTDINNWGGNICSPDMKQGVDTSNYVKTTDDASKMKTSQKSIISS